MEPCNVITEIRSRRGSKRREIELDGAPWLTVPRAILAELGISSGDVIEPDDITTRIEKLEPPAARERALRLLAYRDRSEVEMRNRLTEDGFSESVTDMTVSWLLTTGLLDDTRFAEQLARTVIIGRKYGRTRAIRHLQRAGLSDEQAIMSIDVIAPEEGERERTVTLARSLHRTGDSIERLAARLVRRGYGPSDSFAAARTVVGETEAADEHSFYDT